MADVDQAHDLSALLGRAAHDLKNPLTVIRAQAQIAQFQLARPDTDPAALDRRMATIIAATARIAAMLDRMVDGARLARGLPIELDRQPLDVVAIVARVVAAQQAAAGSAIELATELDQLRASLDRARFERALGGLIGWLSPASSGGGPVVVALARSEEGDTSWIVLRARGMGAPLSAEEARHLLARTAQDEMPERAHADLLDARDVATSHGGSIAVEEGTALTIVIRVPIVGVPGA